MISKKIKIAVLAFSVLSIGSYSLYNFNHNRHEVQQIQKNKEESLRKSFVKDIKEINKNIELDLSDNQIDSISKLMLNYINDSDIYIKELDKNIHNFNLKIGKKSQGKGVIDYIFNEKYIEFNNEIIPEYKIHEMKDKIYSQYFSLKLRLLKNLSDDISNTLTSSQLKLIEDYNNQVYEKISLENKNVDDVDKEKLIKRINEINKKENEISITRYTSVNSLKIVDLTNEINASILELIEGKNIDEDKIYKINDFAFKKIKEKMRNESYFIMAEMLLNNGSRVLNPDYYLDSKNNFYTNRASIDKKTVNPISKILFSNKYNVDNNFKEILTEKINYNKSLMNYKLKTDVINEIENIFGKDNEEWKKINNAFDEQIKDNVPLENFMKNIRNENNDLIKIFSTASIIKSMFSNMDNLEIKLMKENIYTIRE